MFEEDFEEDFEEQFEEDFEEYDNDWEHDDPHVDDIIEERIMAQYDKIDKSKLELVEERKHINGKGDLCVWYVYHLPNTNIWYETNNHGAETWYKKIR